MEKRKESDPNVKIDYEADLAEANKLFLLNTQASKFAQDAEASIKKAFKISKEFLHPLSKEHLEVSYSFGLVLWDIERNSKVEACRHTEEILKTAMLHLDTGSLTMMVNSKPILDKLQAKLKFWKKESGIEW